MRLCIVGRSSTSHINGQVKAFIEQQVRQHVLSYAELKRNTERFISDELFAGRRLPTQFNRRFSLTRQDYALLVCQECSLRARLRCDDERVIEKLSSWQALHADDRFLFRPYSTAPTTDPIVDEDRFVIGSSGHEGFLFIYQSRWQKRLLNRYGGLCLLEAASRTAEYPIPLYFLYVRTNADYSVVATMVMQYEDDETIAQAVRVISEWNPEWKPWSFMVDCGETEMRAVKRVFAECEVYLSDYHRERCWERWMTFTDSDLQTVRSEVLVRLRRVALATALYQYNIVKDELTASQVWQRNSSLQKWFEATWLNKPSLWAHAFRSSKFHVLVNTSHGQERLNKAMKQVESELGACREYSVSALITFLVEKFLPEDYKQYIRANVAYAEVCRLCDEHLPVFLRNRPSDLVHYVRERMLATETIDENGVFVLGSSTFSVVAPFTVIAFRVEFGESTTAAGQMPSCNCDEWNQHYWPCRHFCAVFQRAGRGWNELAESYRDCPYFVNDGEGLADEVEVSASSMLADVAGLQLIGSHVEVEPDLVTEPLVTLTDTAAAAAAASAAGEVGEESHEPYGIRCRELLSRITDLTYICTEASSFKTLLNILQTAYSEFSVAVSPPIDEQRAIELLKRNVKREVRRRQKKLRKQTSQGIGDDILALRAIAAAPERK